MLLDEDDVTRLCEHRDELAGLLPLLGMSQFDRRTLNRALAAMSLPRPGSRCRRCGRVSTRVHSRYQRHLADLPVAGRPVVMWLTVRRFFCDHVDCSTCTFVEQVPELTERHARRSAGLRAARAV